MTSRKGREDGSDGWVDTWLPRIEELDEDLYWPADEELNW